MTDRLISGSFKCSLQLSDRRQFEINGYFFSDDTIVEMNQRVDMAQEVLDRQAIRADVTNKEAQITAHLANQQAIKDSFEELISLQQSGAKLTSQQQQAIDNFEPTMDRSKRAIDDLRAAIETGRMKLNGHAPMQ